jgi:hypothetical protein
MLSQLNINLLLYFWVCSLAINPREEVSRATNEFSIHKNLRNSLKVGRIGRINALFTQVQQLWTAVDSFDTPAMQPNPADGEPATLKIYPPLSH